MHLPRATYRIQFSPQFGFKQAKEILGYLSDLGISDLYASPIFKARKGSNHGYDIVDPNQLNPQLGTDEDFRFLIDEAKKLGIFWLQDIVPNHMAYDSQNEMLMDVLENGKDSEYYNFFDIDWDHNYENLRSRVLAPFLGKFYAGALENGEISLKYDEKGLSINYYEQRLPLRVGSYVRALEHNIKTLEERLDSSNADFIKLLGIINLFKSLSSQYGDIRQSEQVRHAKKMLWSLYSDNTVIKQFIDESITLFNGTKGKPESFDALDKLISEQLFRLSFWKVASEEINYRRFFTINELVSVRVEDQAVYSHTHQLIFRLIQDGLVCGLRVDHIDGLFDPTQYLKRLRQDVGDAFIVVEKILAPLESLPQSWPIQGSTGYDFLNYVNGAFCNTSARRAFAKLYGSFAGMRMTYEELAIEKKRVIISKHLAGNIDNLAQLLKRISSRDKYGRDMTLYGLRRALVEVMAVFGVYRTYIDRQGARQEDIQYLRQAIERAAERLPGYFYEINFIGKFLLLQYNGAVSEEDKEQWIDFVMNFQQYTAPLMAKGFEDTVLYIYNPLISLNEVGGSPERFGFSREEFHRFNQGAMQYARYSLNATATHDTKRGEDVRARINVLSEMPQEWEQHLKQWVKFNRKFKKTVHGYRAPEANDEYLLYQTLLGACPPEGITQEFRERVKNYLIKAVREAKLHTAWIKPDTDYENACSSFLERILADDDENEFLKTFIPFQKKISFYGIFNSLSQALLKIASPGIPDFYQGTELWDFNLVDPDNRRPVDFEKRKSFFNEMQTKKGDLPGLIKDLFVHKDDGRIKLFTIYRLLKARNRFKELFENGEYIPLKAEGKYQDNIIVFARQDHNSCCIVLAPRFLSMIVKEDELPLGESIWQDTVIFLPDEFPSEWASILTEQKLRVDKILNIGNVLDIFPVSLLIAKK